MRVFWNSCVKYIVDFLFHKVARIQSTVYLSDCSECSERKGCSKISKTQKKKKKKKKGHLSETAPFSLTQQPCNPEFLSSANADCKKKISFECSDIVGSLPEKGLWWSHFINYTLLKKITSYIFQGMLEKLLLWKFWKIIKKTSVGAFLLKNSSCPIHSHITTPKTDFTASVSFVCLENFQNCWESACGGITF